LKSFSPRPMPRPTSESVQNRLASSLFLSTWRGSGPSGYFGLFRACGLRNERHNDQPSFLTSKDR
jgi:hypothetical protein